MRINYINLFLLFLSLFSISCASSIAQLSAPTQILITEYIKAKEKARAERTAIILSEKLIEDYALRLENYMYVADALITINESIDEKNITDIGIRINSKLKSIWSITIPLDNIDNLIKTKGVEFIDIGIKAFNR